MVDNAPAKAKAAESPATTPSPWVVSPGWDAFWLLSGLWLLLAFVAIGRFEFGVQAFLGLIAIKVAFALVHSWATSYTILFSPLFERARAERPMQFVGIPVGILAGSMVLGLVVGMGPTIPDRTFGLAHWALALYLALFFLGHFWHFAQQDFGVLSLYRTRMRQFAPRDRQVDLYYTRFMTLGVQPICYLYALHELPWSRLLFSAFPVSHGAVQTAATVAVGASILASLGIGAYELSKPNRSFPKLFYLVIIAFHPITLYFVPNGAGLFYVLVYLYSHWMVAISLSWRINRNHALRGDNPRPDLARYVVGFSAVMAAALAIHWTTMPGDPFTDVAFDEYIGHLGVVASLAIGYALGEQLLHYYCDRQLFKFKDPYVRENVGPLLN